MPTDERTASSKWGCTAVPLGWILFALFYLWIYEKDWTAHAGKVLSLLVFGFIIGWGILTYRMTKQIWRRR